MGLFTPMTMGLKYSTEYKKITLDCLEGINHLLYFSGRKNCISEDSLSKNPWITRNSLFFKKPIKKLKSG